jgi:hypothetical protein
MRVCREVECAERYETVFHHHERPSCSLGTRGCHIRSSQSGTKSVERANSGTIAPIEDAPQLVRH